MALIKCSECGNEISDKAQRCPKCGTPVKKHKWRCSECGNMISEEPCPYCCNESNTVSGTSVEIGGNGTSTPAFVAKNKRNRGLLFSILAIAVVTIIIFIALLQHDINSNSQSLHEENSHENCMFVGYADPDVGLSNSLTLNITNIRWPGFQPVYRNYHTGLGYHFH